MVIQMPLRFHGVGSELALDCRLCENIRIVVFVQHVVGDMLNNSGCLFIVNQRGGFDDKLFRIEPELLKYNLLNTGQNRNNCLSGQTGFANELAD